MSDELHQDVWSKQFHKALEAVGKLTEVEKLRLANILIAVSDVKEKPTPIKREIPPPPKPPETRKVRGGELIPKRPCYPEKVEINS